MDTDERNARASVVAAARDLDAQGLNRGTSGNVSVRFRDGLLITPSGLPTARMRPEDIVPLAFDGTHPAGLKPSSEWRFHRDILAARPEMGAVVHAHPIHCTAFALCGREIPAVHYMIAAFGGPNVRCAPYAPYGTAELSELALVALKDRNVCLLANHGMIAAGESLERRCGSPSSSRLCAGNTPWRSRSAPRTSCPTMRSTAPWSASAATG